MNNKICRLFIRGGLLLLLTGELTISYSQVSPTDSVPRDPGGISVYNVQNMAFGAFSHGASKYFSYSNLPHASLFSRPSLK